MNAHVPLSPSMSRFWRPMPPVIWAWYVGAYGELSDLVAGGTPPNGNSRNTERIMLDDTETVQMSEGALSSLMTRLDVPETTKPIMPPTEIRKTSLERITTCRLRCVPYLIARSRISAGALPIPVSGNCRWASVTMMSALNCENQPGKAAPRHTHKGIEATLVLRGAFRDGNRFASAANSRWLTNISSTAPCRRRYDCICLAVNDGALRFTDSFGVLHATFLAKSLFIFYCFLLYCIPPIARTL